MESVRGTMPGTRVRGIPHITWQDIRTDGAIVGGSSEGDGVIAKMRENKSEDKLYRDCSVVAVYSTAPNGADLAVILHPLLVLDCSCELKPGERPVCTYQSLRTSLQPADFK